MDLIERDFFKNKFSRSEIVELLNGQPANLMFNPRSPSVKSLGLQPDKLSNDELIDWMIKEPRLVRRPVVRIEGRTYFGADSRVLSGLIQ